MKIVKKLIGFNLFQPQVRKLCSECQKVQEYLAITEVVETIEDLVQFVKDLSPCLTKVCTELDGRNKDLVRRKSGCMLSSHHHKFLSLFFSLTRTSETPSTFT